MFVGGLAPALYHAPWDQPLAERVVALRRRGAQRRVAYFYEAPDTSTFRYRVFNMIEVLEAYGGDVAASWFAEAEVERLIPLLPMIDVLILCRVRYSHVVNRLITVARNVGCATVFDCDDLVFDTAYAHLILHTLDQQPHGAAWDHWYAYIGRIGATAKLCNRAIVTNDYLAEKFRELRPGCDVRVIGNFLNCAQLAISQKIYAAKCEAGFRGDGQIHFGYFSGSPTHNKDFAIVAEALAQLMARDSRIVLRLVGFMEPGRNLARFAERIERYDLQDFLNLQRLIGETEFNLVPLQDNAFTNCKSELKYFEAAITGTVSLASPTHAFRLSLQDGINGYLVNSTDWEERMATAIESLISRNSSYYIEMAEAGFRDASVHYAGERMAQKVLSAVFAV
jgi:glycosyltransferase involved in cell wall biosynthesis